MGEFEQIVLLALLQRDNNAYGMEVRDEIEARLDRDVSIGALYRTLARLEAKGYVSHSMGEPTGERGGRARKYFRVEEPGRAALDETRETLSRMWEGLTPGAEGLS